MQSIPVKVMEWEYLSFIPGFSRKVDENSTFLGSYEASNGNLLQMCPYNLSVPQLLDPCPSKMGPIGGTETSVRNYHYSLRNSPAKHGARDVGSFDSKAEIRLDLIKTNNFIFRMD